MRSATRSTLSRIVGTITIVRADVGHAIELEPRQPPRRDQLADHPLHDLNGQLAGRHQRQQRDATTSSGPRQPCACGVGDARRRPAAPVPSAIVPR